MSLTSSLYTGLSGLSGASLDLSVIGDNVSNAGTTGFEGSRAEFEDQLEQTLVGGSQVGLGTTLQSVQRLTTQGAITSTGVSTDLALEGAGFFVVKGAQGGVDGTYYTRAGDFTIDNAGLLVNAGGLAVQGYEADDTGAVGGTLGNLAIGEATSPPKGTANITLQANLQADATVPAAWDPTNPAATSNFSTSTTVYDSLGAAHDTQVYFRKTASGTWEWHALADGGGIQGGTAGTPSEIAAGTLAFDATGKLTGATQTGAFNPVGATQPQALAFDFTGVTQFASVSAASFVSQDGFASGDLASVNVGGDGDVTGTFTNGQTRVLGQVAVASFQAPDKLQAVSGNLLAATPDAGEPAVGGPGTGGRASIVAGSLEESNVDLANEFVNMIGAQRNFEANSKTIQTADQLLQELIALKR